MYFKTEIRILSIHRSGQ